MNGYQVRFTQYIAQGVFVSIPEVLYQSCELQCHNVTRHSRTMKLVYQLMRARYIEKSTKRKPSFYASLKTDKRGHWWLRLVNCWHLFKKIQNPFEKVLFITLTKCNYCFLILQICRRVFTEVKCFKVFQWTSIPFHIGPVWNLVRLSVQRLCVCFVQFWVV